MKRRYVFLHFYFCLLFILAFIGRGETQCGVWYHTYAYFCDLDSTIVKAIPTAGEAPFSFIWSTGETTQEIIVPNAIGDYQVTMTDATGCTAAINCHIKLLPPVYYPFTGLACEGDEVLLYLDWVHEELPGLQYLWSTGETLSQIVVTEDMIWQVTVTDPATGCQFISEPQEVDIDPNPDPQIEGPAALCNGQGATLTLTGGPFWVAQWNPGGFYGETLDITEPGLYWVWVQNDTSWCTGTDTIMIGEDNIPPPVLDGPPALCSGQNGTVSVMNANIYDEFEWSNGVTSSSFITDQPGTYTVTVSDDSGCTSSSSITIDDAGESNVLTATTTASTCGESNGSIQLSYSLPGTYTFEWSNGASTQNLQNIPSGIYSVTVTSGNGCNSTLDVNLPDNIIPITINENIAPNSSCLSYNGAINLTINPNENYNILWSNGQTTEDLINLAPGNYTVTVTLGITCTSTESYVVDDLSTAPDLTSTITPALCGEPNGAIDLVIEGGSAPFTFLWSDGSVNEDLQNAIPGNYSVTVTSSEGCVSNASFQIPEDDIQIGALAQIEADSFCTSNNGSIDLSVTPSNLNYTYQWSNGATTEDLNNLTTGNYSVTITHGVSCSFSETFYVDDVSAAPDLTYAVQPATCGEANGSIDLSLTGGIAPFDFSWSNGNSNEDQIGLVPGFYSVTVTAADGCESAATIGVPDEQLNPEISADIQSNTSCSESNGSIDLIIDPANSNYTFAWSTGDMTEDLSELSAGTYIVQVSLASCTQTDTFIVSNENLPFAIQGNTSSNTSCTIPNGSIDLSIDPPGSYTIAWSNGSTSEDQSPLASGNYFVTVTNNAGCSITESFIISDSFTSFSIAGATTANTSCQNANGAIDLSVTPVANYTFQWSTGSTNEDLNNLSGGTYAVHVTDIASGCEQTADFIVENTVETIAISGTVVDENCGLANGSIDLSVSPAGSTISWSNGSAAEDISNLSAGNYIVTVTTPNGCLLSDTFNIVNTSNTFSLSGIPNNNSSCVNPNGTVDLNVTPVGAYTFAWSTGTQSEDIADLDEGSYTVTVSDQSGCSSTATFVIGSNTINPQITPLINGSTCGQANGSISLTVVPGIGNSFQWSNGSVHPSLNNILSGNYTVTVTASNGCTATEEFNLPDSSMSVFITAATTDQHTCINDDGSIDLLIIPDGDYSYAWSNGSTEADLQNIGAGNYSITVTDKFGCIHEQEFIIKDSTVNPLISFVITPASCGQPNGNIELEILPDQNHTYLWSTGSTVEDLTAIPPGNYQVTVTNEEGCSAVAMMEVENLNSNFTVDASIVADSSCVKASGAIDLIVLPVGGYTYFWSNGSLAEDISDLTAGSYSVTITDQLNCISIEDFIIEDVSQHPLLQTEVVGSKCGASDGSIEINVIPADASNQFLWSNGSTSGNLHGLSEGNYSVTVTDDNGCSATAAIYVTGTESLEINLQADLTVISIGESIQCSLQLNVPMNAISSILWTPQEIMSCLEPLCVEQTITPFRTTEISVLVVDTNSCNAEAKLELRVAEDADVYIPNVFTPDHDGSNDRFTVFTSDQIKEVVILEIFDRWGNCVFRNELFPANDPQYGWDGIYNEKLMDPAVFAFRAVVRDVNGEEKRFKGDVTLIR